VLKNPQYREKARWFQKVIAQTRGLDLAADVIERAFKRSAHASNYRADRRAVLNELNENR
jgi:UDP:flavonoid glycosyltransferase YjiC (YdhE family)